MEIVSRQMLVVRNARVRTVVCQRRDTCKCNEAKKGAINEKIAKSLNKYIEKGGRVNLLYELAIQTSLR